MASTVTAPAPSSSRIWPINLCPMGYSTRTGAGGAADVRLPGGKFPAAGPAGLGDSPDSAPGGLVGAAGDVGAGPGGDVGAGPGVGAESPGGVCPGAGTELV